MLVLDSAVGPVVASVTLIVLWLFAAHLSDRIRQRRLEESAATCVEFRARVLNARLGWVYEAALGGKGAQVLLRGRLGANEAELAMYGMLTKGYCVHLTLRGGPWLPSGHEVRVPCLLEKDFQEREGINFFTEQGGCLAVKPLASFVDPSTPLGALALCAAERCGVELRAAGLRVRPETITWPSLVLPDASGVDESDVVLDFVHECALQAGEWARATVAWNCVYR